MLYSRFMHSKKHGHAFARGVLLYAYARALCGFNGNSMKTISALAKERLFEAYQGEKELYLTDGDHHSARTLACRLDSVWMPEFSGPPENFPPGRMRHSSYAEPSIHRIWLGPQSCQTNINLSLSLFWLSLKHIAGKSMIAFHAIFGVRGWASSPSCRWFCWYLWYSCGSRLAQRQVAWVEDFGF